jgi:hypothetical protein
VRSAKAQCYLDGSDRDETLNRSRRFLVVLGWVISRVNAAVIHCSINSDPIGVVDSSSIPGRGTVWEGASNLDPAALFFCNCADFSGNLGQVLVLAPGLG